MSAFPPIADIGFASFGARHLGISRRSPGGSLIAFISKREEDAHSDIALLDIGRRQLTHVSHFHPNLPMSGRG